MCSVGSNLSKKHPLGVKLKNISRGNWALHQKTNQYMTYTHALHQLWLTIARLSLSQYYTPKYTKHQTEGGGGVHNIVVIFVVVVVLNRRTF